MGEKPFRSINLPTSLVKEIEEIIKSKKTPHNTKASFIEDAVRRKVRDFKEEEKRIDKNDIEEMRKLVEEFKEHVRKVKEL